MTGLRSVQLDRREQIHEVVNNSSDLLGVWSGQDHVAVLQPGESAVFDKKLSGWQRRCEDGDWPDEETIAALTHEHIREILGE